VCQTNPFPQALECLLGGFLSESSHAATLSVESWTQAAVLLRESPNLGRATASRTIQKATLTPKKD
jgi:hypothetical protein